jgi:hypothetical protein
VKFIDFRVIKEIFAQHKSVAARKSEKNLLNIEPRAMKTKEVLLLRRRRQIKNK